MKKEYLLKQVTTPINDPAFLPAKVKFYNREFVNFVYKTDGKALRKILPEPLEPIDN